MATNQSEEDDTSQVPYIPYRIDYMKDVFRPKQFIKHQSDTLSKENSENQNKSTVAYTSIYDGIMDVKEDTFENSKGSSKMSEDELNQAAKLYQHIIEIEKKYTALAEETVIPDPSVSFVVHQCACPECSPRFQGDEMMCELCNLSLGSESWVHHSQSICHQVKRHSQPHVYINPFMDTSSNAFKLMSSMGWKEGEGLGRSAQGRLEPIPTRLKNNRLGVGAFDPAPLRVTHDELEKCSREWVDDVSRMSSSKESLINNPSPLLHSSKENLINNPSPLQFSPNEDPAVTRERERLIKKFGVKRLRKILKKYNTKKKEQEKRAREAWLREEFKNYIVSSKHV